jgi:hypothetical protein
MTRTTPLAAIVMALAACGTDNSMPNPWHGTITVTSGVAAGVTTCASTQTVTLSSSAVTPQTVSVPGDGCVMFVNDDGAPHQPASDSHPIHDCLTNLNPAGTPPGTGPVISPGGSFTTAPLGAGAAPTTCGWHDHLNPPGTTVGGGY